MNDGFNDNVNSNYEAEADNLVLNLDGVNENAGFEALPAGTYEAVIENAEYGLSNNGGNPMITWQFRVTTAEYENRMLFFHTVLNKELGVANLKKILVRCVPDVSMAQFKPKSFCEQGVAIGLPCRLKVKVEPYNGEQRNRVTEVLAAAAAGAFLDV